jgi:hypothetical protein
MAKAVGLIRAPTRLHTAAVHGLINPAMPCAVQLPLSCRQLIASPATASPGPLADLLQRLVQEAAKRAVHAQGGFVRSAHDVIALVRACASVVTVSESAT